MSVPRVLQIDAGNSGIKWRSLRGDRVSERGVAELNSEAEMHCLRAQVRSVDEVWLASVLAAESESALLGALLLDESVILRRAATRAQCAGVRNSYAEPERMGVDRWLVLLAARARCATRVCVVDAGTALTIDWLAADGQHEGGYIIPGPGLMEQALFSGTGRVRVSDAGAWSKAPGTDTASAVGSGITLALSGALREALHSDADLRHEAAPPDHILVTGGYGQSLMTSLPLRAEYVQDLVFEGLEIAVRDDMA